VATQDPELRKRFTGNADHVVNFFHFVVTELREIMAELGFRNINEMVGQVQFLEAREEITHWKYSKLDLTPILYKMPAPEDMTLYNSEKQDHGLSNVLDWKLLEYAKDALENGTPVIATMPIINTDRSTGTILSNEISRKYKAAGLPDDTIQFTFTGTAGQSFGAFNTKGVSLTLEGDANDYFGKGLSGARLVVYPSKQANYVAEENIIIGNVAFYGGTSGEAFIRGKAGERYCVRNSGVDSVVEGVGDHGCEYMTGGRAIILGATGRNFAAGMSGGIAYVYDVHGNFAGNCNTEMVSLDACDEDDANFLKEMLNKHVYYTDSAVARFILSDFDNELPRIIKVFPQDYKKVLQMQKAKQRTEA